MAKINGVQIKSLKSFSGHDGELLYQGNVYLNGKLLGFWSQNYSGGVIDDFGFDESLLDNAVNKMKSIQTNVCSKEYYNATSFMCDLITLIEYEKDYKKEVKRHGGKDVVVVFVTDNYNCFYFTILDSNVQIMTNNDIFATYASTFEGISKQLFKNEEEKRYVFRSLRDFNITL